MRTIGGTSFDGSANIAVGLADTATKLATARTIGGTSFDGSANIAVGLEDTATKLATARNIAGVSFDGSAVIAIPYFYLTNKLTAGTGISITTGDASTSPVISATSSESYWALVPSTTNISYSAGNVGIGTSPTNKLHIYDDVNNETKLIIQNNTIRTSGAITSTPPAPTTGTTGNYTYQVFTYTTDSAGLTGQTQYTITAPTGGITCDILMVGGGGGGGGGHGGGGGAGQLILIHQATLNSGTYTIRVGKGGVRGTNPATGGVEPTKGSNSLFDSVIAEGGGANGGNTSKDGGSGTGGDTWLNGLGVKGKGLKNTTVDTYSSGTVYSRGNDGGEGGTDPGQGGGGGGAGTSGGNGANSYTNGGPGNGGDGLSGISEISYDFKTNFGTNVGKLEPDNLIYFAGGGGGGAWIQPVVATGGKGGGGGGGAGLNNGVPDVGKDATNNTGSGGGGGSGDYGAGGNGGSGIIIIRYLSPSTSTSSSLELVRGTTTDGSIDYSVGNYNGSFKVKSVNAGTPTDRMVISSAGNVDIAGSVNIPTGSTYKINDVDILVGKQNIINSTAGQLIIGNGDGVITTNAGLTWTGGNTLNATNLTTTTNLVVGGSAGIVGTSQFTGNVGIGTTSHATYKVDVNGTLNATSLLVNNNPISGSKWTTATDTTRIYYNTGNVGIGTTNPLQILQVGAGGRLRIANGNTDYSLIGCDDADGATNTRIVLSGSSRTGNIGNVDYVSTSTGVHRFYTTSSGTERMTIYNNGAVGIQGTGNWAIAQGMTSGSLTIGNIGQNYGGQNLAVANMAGLMMECSDNTEIVVHDSNTGVHSFMRYTTNGNFRIGRNMGWGVANLYITGPLLCNSYIECDATILSKSKVYARNTFDTLMYSNSSGMFLQMGDIGSDTSPTHFKMGSYSGNTNFWSINNRNIIMRLYVGGLGGAYYGWDFLNDETSYNTSNTTTWNTISDHRIKEDIKKANLQTCYDNVKNINLYRFNFLDGFKEGTKHDRTQLGYIAQQVKQHFPKSVIRSKTRLDDKREIPDLAGVDVSQVNFSLFGAVKQLIRVVEKQSKRIKKLEEMLGIVDDDEVLILKLNVMR